VERHPDALPHPRERREDGWCKEQYPDADAYSADGMVEHDMHIGKFLDKLDELGIADNTIVFYSTDNGPHYNTWPDAASTPFRGEKNTNWEGGWRVPAMVRWPGKIPAGEWTNEIVHHMDWFPTFAAAAGDPAVKEPEVRVIRPGHEPRLQGAPGRLQHPAAAHRRDRG
jgi:arylsulfatase A-like enzyme